MEIMDIETRVKNAILAVSDTYVQRYAQGQKINLVKEVKRLLLIEFESFQEQYSSEERRHIKSCISGDSVFNLTRASIPENFVKYLKQGSKYNPFTTKTLSQDLKLFDQLFCEITNRVIRRYLRYAPTTLSPTENVTANLRGIIAYAKQKKKTKLVNILSDVLVNYRKEKRFFRNFKGLKTKNIHREIDERVLEDMFTLSDGRIILSSDKGLGYTIMNVEDVKDQYHRINAQQHFERADISEEWYITHILGFIQDAKSCLPKQLSKIIQQKDFEPTYTRPSIGTLRLMPKILKLPVVSPDSVSVLKSRGIKSSLNDPIRTVQIILDKFFNHILYYMELEFATKYSCYSPTVSGIDESLHRLRETSFERFGKGVILEADFSDMYSNINENLLKKYVKMGAELAGLNDDSIQYIFSLIEVNMRHSYFHEPDGIFRTKSGFSMGDVAASRGSDVVLRGAELLFYAELHSRGLLQHVKVLTRFRDDIFLYVTGSHDKIKQVLKIVFTGYPLDITLNVESNLIQGKFLNVRLYNDLIDRSPFTTILRKRHTKYDVIPPTSNTHGMYKKCAGRTYFDMVRSHCSHTAEYKRQVDTVKTILTEKGFSRHQILRMKKLKKRLNKLPYDKIYVGKVPFDQTSHIHQFLRNTFASQTFEEEGFSLPMVVPGRKLHQYVFTVKKMRRLLDF
jgi:hypothetical protein